MGFEDVMMKRLASCHSEACDEILAGVKSGRSLSDAVSDTIEALPASKSRDLRRWLEDWEAWEEWLGWKAKGWRLRRTGPRVFVTAPWSNVEAIGKAEYVSMQQLEALSRRGTNAVNARNRLSDQLREMSVFLARSHAARGPSEAAIAAGAGVRRVTNGYIENITDGTADSRMRYDVGR